MSELQHEENDDLPIINPNVDQGTLFSDEKQLIERLKIEKKMNVKQLRLTNKWQRVYNENPHLREVFLNQQRIETYARNFGKENRRLSGAHPEMTFPTLVGGQKKVATTEHWGQRKLLLTEIEFLTKYAENNSYLVVYAGAAPGVHIPFLSSLFPNLAFVLIDDKEFAVKRTNKIEIRAEKFTKEMARRYGDSDQRILFICNVRTYRPQSDGQNDGAEDMQNQMEWYMLMTPSASLLSFRLARDTKPTVYMKGHQIIEPWASRRAIECRLVVEKDARTVEYRYQDFESDLRYFNNVTRVMYYDHHLDDVDSDGLDHCYDCRAEIYILEKYLTKVQKAKSGDILEGGIAKLSYDISKAIEDKSRPSFITVPRTLGLIPKKPTNDNF